MSLTAQAALTQLTQNSSSYGDPQALRDLANQVSADPSGSITVLYSANVGNVSTTDVVNSMVANRNDIRVIDNADVATFLKSPQFMQAVADAFGVSSDDVRSARL